MWGGGDKLYTTDKGVNVYYHTYRNIVLQLTEVGDYEVQNLYIKQMYNRSRNYHLTTEPPILVRCCYVPFFFTNVN